MVVDNIVCCSGGNDSVALIQFLMDKSDNFCVVYNNTGWAVEWWAERMEKIKVWVNSYGSEFYETQSEGFENMVKRKKGFPMPASNMQFCTGELKEKPSLKLYDEIDPNKEADIVTGRRPTHSRSRREATKAGICGRLCDG